VPAHLEEEVASYKLIDKKSAELDGETDAKKATLPNEERQLEAESKAKWSPDTLHSLFESIRPTPAWMKSAAQPHILVSTLRPFQQKALAWMIERECEREDEYEDPLWETARLNDRTVYYQPFLGIVQREKPPLRQDVRGGILADEMGHGKTVSSMGWPAEKMGWRNRRSRSMRMRSVRAEEREDWWRCLALDPILALRFSRFRRLRVCSLLVFPGLVPL
jgi:hypothetical protein